MRLPRLKNFSQETKKFKQRVVIAIILIAILLVILIIRLFNLQVFNYELYADMAAKNKLEPFPIEPNRGLIYDRNGVLLAENLPTFALNIVVEQAKDIKTTLDKLKTVINITPDNLKQFQKALKHRRRFEQLPLKLKLSQEELAAIYVNQYRLPGVVIDTAMIRRYPLAHEMANVLGYVGRINKKERKSIDINNYGASRFIGKTGIEKFYENLLHGKTGHKITEVAANGRIVRTIKTITPIPGDTLYLTIDSKLQKIAQEALNKERGAVVAIDPNNGEILALVSNPSYDPNLFVTGIDNATFNTIQSSSNKPMYNRATKSTFPIASTIKPYIALQALDTGIITPKFQISDPGWFKLENSKQPPYRDWIHNGHGIVNVTKAIIVSCDTFFYTLSIKLGIEKIANILHRFGFGNKTNIDILEESTGIVATPQWKMQHTGKRWYTGDTIISSIGQGYMAATPLQLAHAVATLAMRGKRFQPHLLKITQKPDGTKISTTPIALTPVTLKNQDNWNIVINAMRDVIASPNGTAHKNFGPTPPYTVAAKTGGAQLYHHKTVNENPTPETEDKIPKHLRNHKLFIAFAPIENPKIAVAVVSENSQIAPQVTRKVLDYYLREPSDLVTLRRSSD